MSHTRTSTTEGPDYCVECSEDISEWVKWPCPTVGNRETENCEMCLRTLPLAFIRHDSEGIPICRSCWDKPETWA